MTTGTFNKWAPEQTKDYICKLEGKILHLPVYKFAFMRNDEKFGVISSLILGWVLNRIILYSTKLRE